MLHRQGVYGLIAATVLAAAAGCEQPQHQEMKRDINQVKEAHVDELMEIPGVVGVYVGALDDGRPCIGVMVTEMTAEVKQRCPKELEGYPVRVEVSGTIRPLR